MCFIEKVTAIGRVTAIGCDIFIPNQIINRYYSSVAENSEPSTPITIILLHWQASLRKARWAEFVLLFDLRSDSLFRKKSNHPKERLFTDIEN